MNVFGIGIDIVDTHRIAESIEEHGDRFLNRIYTVHEREYCDRMANPVPHYAARFAAKEAISKAFGTGIGKNLGWTDMEILRDEAGRPFVTLSGSGKAFAEINNITEVKVSLSHSEDQAAANALAICL